MPSNRSNSDVKGGEGQTVYPVLWISSKDLLNHPNRQQQPNVAGNVHGIHWIVFSSFRIESKASDQGGAEGRQNPMLPLIKC